jgi:drug/metabolite transporter (DMT)-like permease
MSSVAPSRPLAGVGWMLVTGLCMIMVTALVKTAGPRLPSAEAAFLRYATGLVFLLPALGGLRKVAIPGRQWALFTLRGVLHTAAVVLWFHAMARLPIAEVTALNYLAPVGVTLGAALFLGERLALRRIGAVCAGLAGALIILRPGFRELSSGHIAMLCAASVFAGSYLIAKVLAEAQSAAVVVAMLSITVTLGLAPFAWAVWIPPTLWEVTILTAVGFFATAGHFAMTLAFAAAPMTVTQPVTFLQLVWATLLGVTFFGEPVDAWVITGGAIILGAVTFITWREAALKRQITPPSHATKL